MTRVEWPVLEGGQVETLLANLIYNLDGHSIRIRPSQGDYGIDVIRPAGADPKKWDVYQIKKFADNLKLGQKTRSLTLNRPDFGSYREPCPAEAGWADSRSA